MDKINFTVNGERFIISGAEVTPTTSLNEYLRSHLGLCGTKAMCHEGGCGVCVVSIVKAHPLTKEKQQLSVNSCLIHILSCHGWDITTVEGLGSRSAGYHPIQKRLADFNGTQCGYCTPGWVMNMHSLQQGSKSLSMKQIERSFGGNICRCTGYRPILDAFKTFASDVDEGLKSKLQDLEDLDKAKCLKKCNRLSLDIENEWLVIDNENLKMIDLSRSRWYKAYTIQDVFKVLSKEGLDSYKFVAGNTGRGVYPFEKGARVLIDISSIDILKECLTDVNLILGAGMTLTEMLKEFDQKPKTSEDFSYIEQFWSHLELVANVPVRNIGTLGGNLALKHQHHDFPSDLFLLLSTVDATITLINNNLEKSEISTEDFLSVDLKNKIILNVKLPPLGKEYSIRTYKIMPRAQNAHAIVNAGFNFKLDKDNKVLDSVITIGNIGPNFLRAKSTENVLKGLDLFSNDTLQKALRSLHDELLPESIPPESSPFCRKTLALGLFYKAVLSLAPSVSSRYQSGGLILKRDVSKGTQTFDTDKSLWPLTQPIPKIEALTQCAGEVQYSCDIPPEPRQLFASFVTSTICVGDIETIDASDALKLPGVISFISAKDIPGENTFIPTNIPWMQFQEEILAEKKISYYGQPIGIIAAANQILALQAAGLVKVTYKKSSAKPVLTIRDALVAPDKDKRIRQAANLEAKEHGSDIKHTITGSYTIPSQYHFTMETQQAYAKIVDGTLEVRSSSQWPDLVHVAVAKSTGLKENQVHIKIPRVGGGYGGKASRSSLVACAAGLVALHTNRPTYMIMAMDDNMHVVGKRQACEVDYEVTVNSDGLIQSLTLSYYTDCGCSFNDSPGSEIVNVLTNLYVSKRWKVTGYDVLTDKAANTWCRAPGTTEGVAIAEHIMERIAHVTNLDPISIRLQNLSPEHSTINDMLTTFKNDSNYDSRKVEIAKYNTENAWKKKGVSLSLMSYPIGYFGNFAVTISVYHADGTISLSHGGVEMGQGINTKVAQVVAFKLKVGLDKVAVRGNDSFVSPNSMASNGSITSESVAYAALKACDILLDRLQEVKDGMNEPTWEEVVKAAYDKGINLQSSYMMSSVDPLIDYNVYGVCSTEIILDVLTGDHIVSRVDLMEDTGQSMSPEIDVGQIEGAFVMGLGLWTTENLVYDMETGKLLSDRTWNYTPSGAMDVPVDFRIAFRRNSFNTAGVLRSKATGEPALTLAVTVTQALHNAIVEARKEFNYDPTPWIHIDAPYNTENILKAISPKIENYKLQ